MALSETALTLKPKRGHCRWMEQLRNTLVLAGKVCGAGPWILGPSVVARSCWSYRVGHHSLGYLMAFISGSAEIKAALWKHSCGRAALRSSTRPKGGGGQEAAVTTQTDRVRRLQLLGARPELAAELGEMERPEQRPQGSGPAEWLVHR